MVDQRLRRWPTIEPTMAECLVVWCVRGVAMARCPLASGANIAIALVSLRHRPTRGRCPPLVLHSCRPPPCHSIRPEIHGSGPSCPPGHPLPPPPPRSPETRQTPGLSSVRARGCEGDLTALPNIRK